MAGIIDSYAVTPTISDGRLSSVHRFGMGQSFTGNGATLGSAKMWLRRKLSPTGNLVFKIYAHSGTFGTNGIPTGAALAVSGNLDVSTIATVQTEYELFFTGANQIVLTNGTNYFLTAEYSGGNSTNYLDTGNVAAGHAGAGNPAGMSTLSVWTTYNPSAEDIPFTVLDNTSPSTRRVFIIA